MGVFLKKTISRYINGLGIKKMVGRALRLGFNAKNSGANMN